MIFMGARHRLERRLDELLCRQRQVLEQLYTNYPESKDWDRASPPDWEPGHGAKVVVGATDLLVEKAIGIPWVGVLGVAVFGAIKGIGASISQIPREFKKPSEQRQLEAAARKHQSEIGDVRSSISATRLGDFLFLLLLALIVVIVTWCVS